MANAEHVERLKEGFRVWNQWREENPNLPPDLIEADLRGIDLSSGLTDIDLIGADLSGVNLTRADLCGADLRRADLSHTKLWAANLRNASLINVNLRHADLREANLLYTNLGSADLQSASLREAKISGANLSGVSLFNTTFSGVCLIETVFANVDLSDTKGLSICEHIGPSPVDHRTLNQSGPLPLAFLRGCGLSDWEIEATKLYQKGLSQKEISDIIYRIFDLKTDDPIQYQSCFISHSTKDEPFCRKLYDALQESGVRCWFSPEHIRWGDKLRPQIDEAIHQQDRLLLVLTETSLQSPWVEYEIRRAIAREQKEQRRILFPLRLVDFDVLRDWACFDDDTGKDLAWEVRAYFIPDDFTHWEDDAAFAAAFERLLANLRQERRPGR